MRGVAEQDRHKYNRGAQAAHPNTAREASLSGQGILDSTATMSPVTSRETTRTSVSTTPDVAEGTGLESALAGLQCSSVPPSRLALLHRATLAFNSSLDLNAVLHSVLQELSAALRVDGWAVWLLDPRSGQVECVQSEGPFSAKLLGQQVSRDEGALGWVMRHAQSIYVAHPDEDPRYNDALTRRVGPPLGSLLCAPLKGRATTAQGDQATASLPAFGAISVISHMPAAFDNEDLAVLEALAASAAVAIENARLYAQANLEVAERRRVERALRQSENQYRTMAETSPDGIVVTDLDGIITNCNVRTLELHGFEHRTEILGKGVLMLFAPQCRADVLEMHRSILEGRATQEREVTLLRKDEEARTVMYTASLVAGEDGSPISVIGFSHDVSDRRAAEDAVRRHNQELRILNRIATGISQVRDLGNLLSTVHSLILEILEVDTGCSVLFDEPAGPGSPALSGRVASPKLVIPELSAEARGALQEWLANRLREGRRPLLVSSREVPFSWAATLTDFQILAVPLSVQNQVAGMLAVAGLHNGRPRAIRPQQRQLLSAIGHQVSVAVENARLTAKVAEMDMLHELGRMRSELLAAFSHDLRTPLGLIQMACSTLQRDDIALDDLLVADLLDDIETQTERLSRLVDGILDLDHLESGRLRMDLVDLDVVGVLELLAEETELAYPTVSVTVVHEADLLTAWADAGRIDQVLRNLLDNAVKYMPQGGEIVARVTRQGQSLRVSVTDDGVGIPADQREMVFERFYRVRSASTLGIPGTGLGLATCRSIVEAHGGRIWVEPRQPGDKLRGATLTFTLPASPTAPSAQAGPSTQRAAQAPTPYHPEADPS